MKNAFCLLFRYDALMLLGCHVWTPSYRLLVICLSSDLILVILFGGGNDVEKLTVLISVKFAPSWLYLLSMEPPMSLVQFFKLYLE